MASRADFQNTSGPEIMTTGSEATRESYAISLMDTGYEHAGVTAEVMKPVEDLRMTKGQTKWIPQPFVAVAMDARLNNTQLFQESWTVASQYFEAAQKSAPAGSEVAADARCATVFSSLVLEESTLSTGALAGKALYEARNSVKGPEFLARWTGLMDMHAKEDLPAAADTALRLAVFHKPWAHGDVNELAIGMVGKFAAQMKPEEAMAYSEKAIELAGLPKEAFGWNIDRVALGETTWKRLDATHVLTMVRDMRENATLRAAEEAAPTAVQVTHKDNLVEMPVASPAEVIGNHKRKHYGTYDA